MIDLQPKPKHVLTRWESAAVFAAVIVLSLAIGIADSLPVTIACIAIGAVVVGYAARHAPRKPRQ